MLNRIWHIMLAAAVLATVVYLGAQEPNVATADPNPMKMSQAQFDRIHPTYFARGQ